MKTNSEDGPWEEENQICTNEIDPPCGGAKTLLGQQQQKADVSHAMTVKRADPGFQVRGGGGT